MVKQVLTIGFVCTLPAIAVLLGMQIFDPANGQIFNPTQMVVPRATVATIPACNNGNEGALYIVSDALLPAFGATLAGGGVVHILVVCNGSNWITI